MCLCQYFNVKTSHIDGIRGLLYYFLLSQNSVHHQAKISNPHSEDVTFIVNVYMASAVCCKKFKNIQTCDSLVTPRNASLFECPQCLGYFKSSHKINVECFFIWAYWQFFVKSYL